MWREEDCKISLKYSNKCIKNYYTDDLEVKTTFPLMDRCRETVGIDHIKIIFRVFETVWPKSINTEKISFRRFRFAKYMLSYVLWGDESVGIYRI